MAGSSVATMIVGTVFIMLFGMATVSMIESIDESVRNSKYELPDPEVDFVSVTDKEESTGPVQDLAISTPGTGYTEGDTCSVSGSSGTNLEFTISVDGGTGAVTSVSITNSGSGYSDGEVLDLASCDTAGGEDAQVTLDIHDKITITIVNSGSDTVELAHILITISDTATNTQGNPFSFTDHYSGGNLYLFPGEQISTDSFTLDSTNHGFAIEDDPDRAFLAIFDYNSAISVTDS